LVVSPDESVSADGVTEYVPAFAGTVEEAAYVVVLVPAYV
jgi:hypothetical protein